MKVYYDTAHDLLYVEGTQAVWRPRSLIAGAGPYGITISTVYGTAILGPLQPQYVERQDGSTFPDLPSCMAYLTGELSKSRTLGLAFPFGLQTLWTIPHGLGSYPTVTTVDTAGEIIFGTVSYTDSNTVSIGFTYAVAGTAYLN